MPGYAHHTVHLQLLQLPLSPGQHRGGALLLPSVKLVGRMLGLPGNVRGHADHQRPSAGSQAQELLEAAHLRDNGTAGRAVAHANNQIARATSNEARATMSKARAMANIARTCACASCCCCCCCCWAICTRCCCWSSWSVACCTAACCWSCCCCTCCCCGCSSSLTAVVLTLEPVASALAALAPFLADPRSKLAPALLTEAHSFLKAIAPASVETASTHNKSVARATETVVRTASTCGCMLHGVVDGCCSPGCTAACGGGCGVAPAPVAPAAVVGGAAGGGYPQPMGCMGKRVTLKYPCSSSNTKRKMQYQKNRNHQKKRTKRNKSMHSKLEAHLKCVYSHSTLLPIIYRDFKGSGA